MVGFAIVNPEVAVFVTVPCAQTPFTEIVKSEGMIAGTVANISIVFISPGASVPIATLALRRGSVILILLIVSSRLEFVTL